jgi:hypothetical protein
VQTGKPTGLVYGNWPQFKDYKTETKRRSISIERKPQAGSRERGQNWECGLEAFGLSGIVMYSCSTVELTVQEKLRSGSPSPFLKVEGFCG